MQPVALVFPDAFVAPLGVRSKVDPGESRPMGNFSGSFAGKDWHLHIPLVSLSLTFPGFPPAVSTCAFPGEFPLAFVPRCPRFPSPALHGVLLSSFPVMGSKSEWHGFSKHRGSQHEAEIPIGIVQLALI